MWFNLTIIVSVLLCNCCLSFALQGKNSNGRKEVKFDDLDGDVLYIIYTFSDVRALTNMAEINPRFAHFAGEAFSQRYRNYEVAVWEQAIVVMDDDNEPFDDYDDIERLVISDHNLALNMLKHFGGHMKNVRANGNTLPGNHSAAILRAINEHTSQSLTTLQSTECKGDVFTQFRKPFQSVEAFTCTLQQKQVGEILPFNAIFPNLRRFTLTISSPKIDYSIFNVNMPHLEHLEINVIESQFGWKHKDTIEGLVQKNPQIRSATLLGFPEDYIENINQLLPNVVELEINEFNTFDEPIHVNNVKKFTLENNEPYFIDQLTFSQLESIKIKFLSDFFQRWMVFFGNNKKVSKLNVRTKTNEPIGQELVDITDVLPELVDLTVYNVDATYVDVISRIIQRHNKLMRFELQTRGGLDIAQILELFDDEWHISSGDFVVILERRTEVEAEEA